MRADQRHGVLSRDRDVQREPEAWLGVRVVALVVVHPGTRVEVQAERGAEWVGQVRVR